jgi:hypothetical protein
MGKVKWQNLFEKIILRNSFNNKQGCKDDFTRYWTLGHALSEFRSTGQMPPPNGGGGGIVCLSLNY